MATENFKDTITPKRKEHLDKINEILNSLGNFKSWLIENKEKIDDLNHFSSDDDRKYWNKEFNKEIREIDRLAKRINDGINSASELSDLDEILKNAKSDCNEIEYSSRTFLTNYAKKVIQNHIFSIKDQDVYVKLPDISSRTAEDLFLGNEDVSILDKIRTENPRDMIGLLEEVNEIMKKNGLLKDQDDNLNVVLPSLSGVTKADDSNSMRRDAKQTLARNTSNNKF
jgi:hypothetical protein